MRRCVTADDATSDKRNNLLVCRIRSHHERIEPREPYKDRSASSAVGTGFVIRIDKRLYIATAFHVIDCTVKVDVVFDSFMNGSRLAAVVLGGNPHLDVALLSVEQLSSADLGAFDVADSDALMPLQRVRCIGFALGDTIPQSSAGVVSARVAVPNRIQIDLAVNGGNSGGPLVDVRNRVVGIITSGMNAAQNINYAAPMHEATEIFQRIAASQTRDAMPHYEMGVDFNCHFAKLNQTLLSGIPGVTGGAFVTHVNRTLDAKDSLHAGDVVFAFELPGETQPRLLDVQMRLQTPWWSSGRLMFHTILDRMRINADRTSDGLIAHVLRDDGNGSLVKMRTTLRLRPPMQAFRELFPFVEPLPYVARAGVVVQLDNDSLSASSWSQARRLCKYLNFPEMDMYSTLIVTHIAPDSPFTGSDTIAINDHVVAVNNVPVQTLHEFAEAFQNTTASLITLRMRDGSMASASVSDIVAYEAAPLNLKRTSGPGAVSVAIFGRS